MRSPALLFALPLTLAAGHAGAESLWSTDGFDTPESVLFDPASERVIVSVIAGAPDATDGNGHLALLGPDGSVIDANWATGMDAPKGMAIAGGRIFVADITLLRIVDAETGELLESIPADGSILLNDVTSDGETVYVSDMMANAIWRYTDGTFEKWLESETLSLPNGLFWDDNRLLVGSWGSGIGANFSTEEPGSLLAVNPETMEISVISQEVGNIDGVARVGDRLVLSDWPAGKIYAVTEDGTATEILSGPAGFADISAHGNVIYIPHMTEGRIEAVAID